MKVAGYGRVSTLTQALKGTSAEDQHDRIKAECEAKGYELYHFYSDEGFSGKSMENRPGLKELIRDAKDHKFDLVFFTKLDRLGRNLRDLLNVWHLLQEEHGLELVCIEDPSINTKGKFGKAMLGLLGVFAEFERDLIRERTAGGRKIKQEAKTAFFGTLPLGYRWNGGIKVVREEKALYRRIVSLYLDEHLTMKDIAIRLSAEGVPPPSATKKFKQGRGWKTKARRWNHTTISKILRNGAYRGEAIQNRYRYKEMTSKRGRQYMWAPRKSENERPQDEWVTVEFPPLISERRWNEIQARIKEQKKKPRKIHKGYEDHFLAENVLFCGHCGGKMKKRLKVEKNGKKRFYYFCYWQACGEKELTESNRRRCILKSVDAELVDRKVFGSVQRFVSNPRKYAKKWLRDINLEDAEAQVSRLEERKARLEKAVREGYNLIAEESDEKLKKVLLEEYNKKKGEYSATLTDLEEANARYNFARNKIDRLAESEEITKMKDPWARLKGDYSFKGNIARFLKNQPLKEKKRIIEAVVSKETGGQATIRYPQPVDVLDDDDLHKLPKDKWYTPITETEPFVEVEFGADLGKIQALIAGLDRMELLDKFNFARVSHGQENARRRRGLL